MTIGGGGLSIGCRDKTYKSYRIPGTTLCSQVVLSCIDLPLGDIQLLCPYDHTLIRGRSLSTEGSDEKYKS